MGKRLDYSELIKEPVSDLQKLERRQSEVLFRDRIRYLRVLKSGEAKTQKEASELVGISERQGQRHWQLYRQGGLLGILRPIPRPGAPTKLKEKEFEELDKRLESDDLQFLHEAVAYVKEQYKTDYTVSGMHYVFKRLKVKKKTGRPVNIRQDKEGMEDFKKNSNP